MATWHRKLFPACLSADYALSQVSWLSPFQFRLLSATFPCSTRTRRCSHYIRCSNYIHLDMPINLYIAVWYHNKVEIELKLEINFIKIRHEFYTKSKIFRRAASYQNKEEEFYQLLQDERGRRIRIMLTVRIINFYRLQFPNQ